MRDDLHLVSLCMSRRPLPNREYLLFWCSAVYTVVFIHPSLRPTS